MPRTDNTETDNAESKPIGPDTISPDKSKSDKNQMLRQLPGVDHLLTLAEKDKRFHSLPRNILLVSVRDAVEAIRKDILAGRNTRINDEQILSAANHSAKKRMAPKLVGLINATGVVLHTNLGRSLLCDAALDNIRSIAQGYSNLEFNINMGRRGSRYDAVEELICELTGAQSAIAVNNNAGAVLLALNTLAENKEVVVSRGELVEIGGSFRIPDVMSKSGGILKEVGTTNRTHAKDFVNALSDRTGLFLKVHASNYKIKGFTSDVPLKELVEIGHSTNIPVMEDLGSGTLIDFSKYSMPSEPTVFDSVAAGADVITFSGDKLLGGPQAGIIVGKKPMIEQIKQNPMTRALRIDKLTLAALESTLNLYRDEQKAVKTIPTLKMLCMPVETLYKKADTLFHAVKAVADDRTRVELSDMNSRPGGGSFPDLELPTRCVTIRPSTLSVAGLEKQMRLSHPAIIGRIEDNRYILDPRTIQEGQEDIISSTLSRILDNNET